MCKSLMQCRYTVHIASLHRRETVCVLTVHPSHQYIHTRLHPYLLQNLVCKDFLQTRDFNDLPLNLPHLIHQ